MVAVNVQAQPPTLSRLSDVKINAHVAPPTAERLTRIEVDAWVSLDQAFYALGVFGSNEVMMPDFLVEPIFDTPAAPEVEVNPYRAAEANTDLQQILREQHMTTQAGDSTFHWGVLTEIYNEPLYNLGSLGKFYHDTLGIIHARYCRFVDFNHTDAKAVPVGMRKPLNLPWTVTNQIDLSSADAVIGMAIPYDEKVNIGTWYGWVITEGFVPAEPATATSNLEFGFGTEYGWNASGELKQELDVVSVGYRTAIGGTPRLVPGAFYVNTDRSSLGKANGLITARITPLVDDIGGIKVRLTTLEAGHAAQELALTAINKKHDDFATFMTKEVQNLANAMNAIRALMPDGNFKEYVDTSINNLKGYVDTQLTITNQVANSALAKAQQALSAIDSMSYDAIQVQINALNNAMGGITNRIIGFKTTIDTNTLVAGQTLVSYLYDTDVDGVNYYDFRPVDFKVQELLDVDWAIPPVDGEVLIWDGPSQKFVPGPMTGGGGGGGGSSLVGSHRYWKVHDIATSQASQAVACSEMRLRATPGGANLVPSSSYCVEENGSYPSSNLYNGNLSDLWGVSNASQTPITTIVFDMGVAVEVQQIMVAARNDSFYIQAPRSLSLSWSDDGVTFTPVSNVELGTFTAAGQQKTALIPASYPYGGGGDGDMQLISSTILAADAASISFAAIPLTYKALRAVMQLRGTTGATNVDFGVRCNGDSGANYNYQIIHAFQSGTAFAQVVGDTYARLASIAASAATAGYASAVTLDMPFYNSAWHKQGISKFFSSLGTGGFTQGVGEYGFQWNNAAPITDLQFLPTAGNLAAGSSIALYGLK